MHSTMKTFLSGAILLGIGSTAFADAVTYAVPDETAAFKPGPNVEVAQNNCSLCHSADYINTQPPQMGEKFWDGEVHKMIKTYGAPMTEDDAKTIIDYLSKTY